MIPRSHLAECGQLSAGPGHVASPDDLTSPDLTGVPTEAGELAELHESIAQLHAERGQFEHAYLHLRSAFDLIRGHGESTSADLSLPVEDYTQHPDYTDDHGHIPAQLRNEMDRLRRAHAEAREQSLRDSLTASYNRRYLDQRLTALTTGPQAAALTLALVDLDFFKAVNDTFGHLLGDKVLQLVVDVISDGLPADAFCARFGGEEFVLVLPGIHGAEAVEICEAARLRVEKHPWHELVDDLRVTISIGLAHQNGEPVEDAPGRDEQLRVADELLYVAKKSGRNAVAYVDHTDGVPRLAGPARMRRLVVGTTR